MWRVYTVTEALVTGVCLCLLLPAIIISFDIYLRAASRTFQIFEAPGGPHGAYALHDDQGS